MNLKRILISSINTTQNKAVIIFIIGVLTPFFPLLGQTYKSPLVDAVEFKTVVDKKKLAKGQRVMVSFISNVANGEFEQPDFKGFDVVGKMINLSRSFDGNKVSQKKTVKYTLSPNREGKITIKPAKIKVGGVVYKSNSVTIQVVKSSELPQNPNDPYYIASNSTFLKVVPSKVSPYVGEGIYTECFLYYKNSIHEYHIKELPKYIGFFKKEIPIQKIKIQKVTHNGEEYHRALMFKTLLTPQHAGRLLIEPFVLNLSIGIPTGQVNFFGDPITHDVSLNVKSKKQHILAKQLPEKGKPDNFKGAVGDFVMNFDHKEKNVNVNKSVTVELGISGKGNLNQIKLPKIVCPPALEIYGPERKESIKFSVKDIKGEKGNIKEKYTLVPQKAGSYKIPSISFSYFNPKDKQYHTLKSKDLWIHVNPDRQQVIAAGTNNLEPATPTKPSDKLNGVTTHLHYLQQKSTFRSLSPKLFFDSRGFYLLLLLILSVIPLTILITKKQRNRRKDLINNAKRKAHQLARKYLKSAYNEQSNREMFYEALEHALYNYLKSKTTTINISQMNQESIEKYFDENSIDSTLKKEFIDILMICKIERYTPTNHGTISKDYEKAKQLIIKLDKYL